jgi:hypothetical protein
VSKSVHTPGELDREDPTRTGDIMGGIGGAVGCVYGGIEGCAAGAIVGQKVGDNLQHNFETDDPNCSTNYAGDESCNYRTNNAPENIISNPAESVGNTVSDAAESVGGLFD